MKGEKPTFVQDFRYTKEPGVIPSFAPTPMWFYFHPDHITYLYLANSVVVR